jgi:uncharacterized damage-inducible protein DinB
LTIWLVYESKTALRRARLRLRAPPSQAEEQRMAVINKVKRPEFSLTGDEAEILWSMLDYYRSTLLWKCEGLSEDQLRRRSVPPSELSLLDLLRHLAGAERHWFQRVLLGRNLEPLYSTTANGEIDPRDPTPAEEVVQRFLTACKESRSISSVHSLDEVVPSARTGYGRPASLRFIAVHMIEEYARHCGHADLLRETIDGAVGD